jgi:hypothetical protein
MQFFADLESSCDGAVLNVQFGAEPKNEIKIQQRSLSPKISHQNRFQLHGLRQLQ